MTIRDLEILDLRFPTSRTHAGHRRGAHRSRLLGGLRHPADRRRPRGARPDVHDRPRQRSLRRGDRRLPPSRRRPAARRHHRGLRRLLAAARVATRSCAGSGPEKGVIHLALAAIVNAVWDLYAKAERKPLWKLLADMTPRQIVSCIDFRYITDALTPDEALDMLERQARDQGRPRGGAAAHRAIRPTRRRPAGWATPTTRFARCCREALADGWTHFKVKVGGRPEDDARRVGSCARRSAPTAR